MSLTAIRPQALTGTASAYPSPRIREHSEPSAVFTRAIRPPGILRVAKRALRVRHRQSHAAVFIRDGRNAERRTIRVRGITRRNLAIAFDVARGDEPARVERTRRGVTREFRAPLPVRHGDRQHRAVHAGEEHRRRALDLGQREAPFELLATVAHEARPLRGARDDLLERGEHLAAVADAER